MLVQITVNSKLFVAALLFSLIPIFAVAQNQTVTQGIQKYQQGNFQEAIDLLELAKINNSINAQGYIVLASSYLEIQIPEKAEINAVEGKSIFSEMLAFDWIGAEELRDQRKAQEAGRQCVGSEPTVCRGKGGSGSNFNG